MAGYLDISIKLDEDFVECLKALKKEYGNKLTILNGLSNSQLNNTEFIDNFIDKNSTTADASIDGNANASTKDICSLMTEMRKPELKLESFNKIFYELKKKYGLEVAKDWLKNEWDGHFYNHDAYSTSFLPYCFAYDLKDLAEKGLYFIQNNFNAQPPKHLSTFTDFVGEFVSFMSNRSSGACGLPNFLIYSFYFWKKDCENGYYIKSPEYYRDQAHQEIIFRLNQPFLRVNQSAFTNITIFDSEYFEALFGDKQFPDGSYMIDYEDEFMEYQKSFMRMVSKIRDRNMMTFPVLTYALLRIGGKFADEDFARWCCKHNMKWNDSNFYISEDVTSLSNCCFSGDQYCLSKSSDGVNYMTFKELFESPYNETKRNFTVFHNGNWVNGKLIKLPAREMYKVVTTNNKELYMTDNHLTPTLRGDISTDKLTTEDYIEFNTKALNGQQQNKGYTYKDGYLIGMYLGDGSMDNEHKDTYTTTVNLSLNEEKYNLALNNLPEDVVSIMSLNKIYNNVYPVVIRNDEVAKFIREYVSGNYCNEKELNLDCLFESIEFRKGIVDGYYATDGGNSNRIYSTSKKLIYEMEALFTSLGMNTIIDVSDRTGDGMVVIREEEFNRNYPVYCIRWYETIRRKQKNVYVWKNNSIYFKIKSIEKIDYDDDFVYCFEMENEDEPYFTLPNGVITHNCRLVSNVEKIGYFNSIGGTALEVGSIKVNTINLARIAYESSTKEEYFKSLKERTILCCETLDVIRHIIKRNIEKGLLPNYTCGALHMESQYNTIGIIGIYEAVQKFGFTYQDEFGNTFYTDEGLQFAKDLLKCLTDTKEEFAKDKDYMINIEQIPGERAAAVLMQKDQMFFPEEAYELPLYGNQWIPLGVKTTLNEKIRISAELDRACSGGSIAHVNLDAPLTNFDTAWNLLNYIADQGVNYFAFCVRISTCKNNHSFFGKTCPICGEPVATTWQRIVGFLTPEKSYSKERKAEFALRDWYEIDQKGELF